MEEILNSCTHAQELGIRCYLEARLAIRGVHVEKVFQLLPGSHGHSASLNDELWRICRKRDLFCS